MKVKAYAKINLFLDILHKRQDGYHELDMIMQSVTLYDTLHIKKIKSGIIIKCNKPLIPLDQANTVYKAAELFLTEQQLNIGVSIRIDKKIPVEAGLAGGSTDAAATLVALNRMFETKLSEKQLRHMALKVGSDVPFCIEGGTKRAKGRGELLEKVSPLPKSYFVIIKPHASVSTKYAYSLFDRTKKNINIARIIKAIESKDISHIGKNLYNEFEDYIIPYNYEIRKAKEFLDSFDNEGCLMTGSGSAIYSLHSSLKQAKEVYTIAKKKYKDCFLCQSKN
ncbi:MAG: 4-(cytidine 5'-diphospho)-2-C-methyl-D-erythritol kinase [Clostridia bacterium]|nr:4-(cytidine 5'-diphospho)-2-C-methyl-D-erythritol kinase [Clostridia bacterium]